MYELFTFENLNSFHLGVSKILRGGLFANIPFETILSDWCSILRQRKPLVQVRSSILCACNTYPAIIEKNDSCSTLKEDYFWDDASSDFSRALNKLSVGGGILEEKDSCRLDVVISSGWFHQ